MSCAAGIFASVSRTEYDTVAVVGPSGVPSGSSQIALTPSDPPVSLALGATIALASFGNVRLSAATIGTGWVSVCVCGSPRPFVNVTVVVSLVTLATV